MYVQLNVYVSPELIEYLNYFFSNGSDSEMELESIQIKRTDIILNVYFGLEI